MEYPSQSSFTHDELLKITSSVLTELLAKDPYLSTLPGDVNLEEVNNQIALLHGKSITVYVERGEDILPVIVPQSGSRVYDLKRAIKQSICLKLKRDQRHTGSRNLSWKYVWKTYNLMCGGVLLQDNNMLLNIAGVVHKSHITFVKRKRNKNVYV